MEVRKNSCLVVIKECEELISLIDEEIKWHLNTTEEPVIYIAKLTSFFVQCRSILEFCSKDIFENVISKEEREKKLKSNDKNVYFPYGRKPKYFYDSLNRNLPGLSDRYIQMLITDLQDFKRSKIKRFLSDLCEFGNDNKHDDLTENLRKSDKQVSIGGAFHVDETSTLIVNNSVIDGVPTGSFTVKKGDISGNINPSLLSQVLIWNNGTYVFKSNNKNIIDFLKLCLSEVTQFYTSLYQRIQEKEYVQ